MGILDLGLRVYGESWKMVSSQVLSKDDVAGISGAYITSNEYGPSVCMHLKSGGMQYLSVDRDSQEKAKENMGKSVDLIGLTLKKLERDGETCYKITL